MKPFTIISAILFLLIAACHAYRAYAGIDFIFGTFHVPIVASWVAAAVTAFLGLMLFVERGR
ncbi:MAG: hypothetical protein ABSD21_10830 [Rhizomicrobium sp.]